MSASQGVWATDVSTLALLTGQLRCHKFVVSINYLGLIPSNTYSTYSNCHNLGQRVSLQLQASLKVTVTTLHYATQHYTTLHYKTLRYTTQRNTTLHNTTLTKLRYTTQHYTKQHYTALHKTTLHYTTQDNTTQDYTTLHGLMGCLQSHSQRSL